MNPVSGQTMNCNIDYHRIIYIIGGPKGIPDTHVHAFEETLAEHQIRNYKIKIGNTTQFTSSITSYIQVLSDPNLILPMIENMIKKYEGNSISNDEISHISISSDSESSSSLSRPTPRNKNNDRDTEKRSSKKKLNNGMKKTRRGTKGRKSLYMLPNVILST